MAPLAIFDIDGTLVDSRRIISLSMDAAFKREGLPPPGYEVTRRIVGLSLEVAIDRIAPPGVEHEGVMRITQYYKDAFIAFRQDPATQSPLYDGAKDVLDNLRNAGWEIGVATGKSRRGLDAVIERMQLAPYFDAHYCADDGPGKPHPFMVDANLKALSRRPEEAIMIGDTSFDIHMAQAASVATIGVDWGFHTPAELSASKADVIVSKMDDLNAELLAFAARRGS
jgi:phosphoglycolate phosphatase